MEYFEQFLSAAADGDTEMRSRAQTTLAALETAVEAYYLDVGQNPPSLSALLKAPEQLDPRARWSGPYLRAEEGVVKDPWGQPYEYVAPGTHNPKSFDLWSRGPDRADGTTDDIGNWPAR